MTWRPGTWGSTAMLLLAVACSNNRAPDAELVSRTGALITGSFAIRLPAGVYPQQVVMAASESLKLADDVRLLEPDQTRASAANVGLLVTELGVTTQVKDLWSASGVFLRSRAHVFCSVNTSGVLSQQSQVVVDGAVNQSVDLGVRTAAIWNVTFPTAQRNVVLEPGQSTSIGPGGYGVFHAKSRATVTLTQPGAYYFSSFFLEPEATLVVNNNPGPVYVFVSGGSSFTWRGSLQKQNAGLHNVLFGYLGSADAVIDAPFVGTAVAPNARMNLISTSQGYAGSFFAKSISTAQPHVTYTHRVFNPGTCAPGSSACAVGLGCPDQNGNDKPDCQECQGGVPPSDPPSLGFTWTPTDPTSPHALGIAPEGDRFMLAPFESRTLGPSVRFPPRAAPVSQVAAADLDDSGFADAAFIEGECAALKWIRRANGAPARYDLDHPLGISTAAALRASRLLNGGDLDGDGFDDLVLTANPRGVLESFDILSFTNNGNGTQFATSTVPSDYQSVTVVDQALADLDQDGLPDLAVGLRRNAACGDTLELFRNSGQIGAPYGTHATASVDLLSLIPRRSRIDAMTAGDFDGDCKPDLWILAGGDLLFLKGRGDLTFAAPVLTGSLTGFSAAIDADHLDVDSDGKQDLLIASGGVLRWFAGNGGGAVATSAAGTVEWGRRVSVWQKGCVR